MNEFVNRNYFMNRTEHSAYSILPLSCSIIRPFQVFGVPSDGIHESFPLVILVFHSDEPRWQYYSGISPTTLLSRFPFFSTYLDAYLTLSSLGLSSTLYWEFGLTPPKESIIVRYSESDLQLSTSYYNYFYYLEGSIIIDPNNTIQTLCLPLFVKISNLTPFILSPMPSYASYFECQLGRQRKLSEINLNFLSQ